MEFEYARVGMVVAYQPVTFGYPVYGTIINVNRFPYIRVLFDGTLGEVLVNPENITHVSSEDEEGW